MDQRDGASGVDSGRQSIRLKTNDFPVDLDNATIYKYIIKVTPALMNTQEKKFLARRFVAQLNLDRKEDLIYDNKFEILLPNSEPELDNKALQSVFLRTRKAKKESVRGSIVSPEASGQENKIHNEFLTDVLITRKNRRISEPSAFSDEEGDLQICTVYADAVELDLKSFQETLSSANAGENVHEKRRDILNALDKIFLREAFDTSSVIQHGNRIFDAASQPIRSCGPLELRRGLVTETCIVNRSIVRRITPCTGFFLKETNLADLLRLLPPLKDGAPALLRVEEVDEFLNGIKVQKAYRKGEVLQTLALMAGNPDQETFYWNKHKTTTVSNYIEKVYPAADVSQDPDQKCVLVRSSQHDEILPSRLCTVLPGQYFPFPASKYFANEEKAWQKEMAEHNSKCVSGMDGGLTKLLKCSTSPTVANRFNVKVPQYGEHSARRPKLFDCSDRAVLGEILKTQIAVNKKDPDISQSVLVLGFTSTEVEALDSLISNGVSKHFKPLGLHVSTHNIHNLSNDDVQPLIAHAGRGFKNGESTVKHAIVGIFCKPDNLGKPGSSEGQKLEFERLRRMYADLKSYCHKEGHQFAGTFLKPTFRSQDNNRMNRAVFSTMCRLKTKVESANAPKALPVSRDISRKMLLLGIHVSELQTQLPKRPQTAQGQAAGWYLVSIVAKWSGSDGFHRARTFLQKSCTSTKDQSFPGALAMTTFLREIIHELVDVDSLQKSTIVVLRAGVPPRKASPEETSKLIVNHFLETNQQMQDSEQSIAVASVDKEMAIPTAGATVANENDVRGTFGARLANVDSELNSEIGVLREFAHKQKARLVHLAVTANTKARLFDHSGHPLFQETACIEEGQATDKGVMRPVSSILAPFAKTPSETVTGEWLIQKRTAEKAGPSTPLLLKYHFTDQQGTDDDSVREALSEACWDFPAPTWSSNNLSCVALAKKANRHATRIVQFDSGKPSLPAVHHHLKDSLYFI